VNSLLTEF